MHCFYILFKEFKLRLKLLFGKLLVVLILLLVPSVHADVKNITFCVYNSDKPSVMHKKFKPIIDYLQHQTNVDEPAINIIFKIKPSYSDAIDCLVTGKCDFVRFGPASYILAKERNKDIKLLVMEHKKGKKRFKGIFIVPQDSPIHSIKDLRAKTFAFGDKNSTIGHYLSQAELVKAGIFASDLKNFIYLKRHDKVALAVANGNYDAGVVKENTYNEYAESRRLRKIGEFPNVTKPWIVRAGFDSKLFDALQQALLKLKDKKILKELKQDGFLLVADEDYDFVREGMRISKQFEKR